MNSFSCSILLLLLVVSIANAWQSQQLLNHRQVHRQQQYHFHRTSVELSALQQQQNNENNNNQNAAEETTKKFGLEAGLFESVKQGDGESAKSLLKKYGIAYLATSIPLAILSFCICYILVDNGVDMGALLKQVGIESNAAGEKAGTFAIAYAAHKAASPIRFPPTVLLTPLVAKWIGKEPNANNNNENNEQV